MAYLCACDSFNDPKKEIIRLRINWIFVLMAYSLNGISYTSISSSFHQFITNPTAASRNQTESGLASNTEPGLGESEVFYSWVVTVFNAGALLGGAVTGASIKIIPYWYIILVGLLCHTIGYVIYAVTNNGWVVMFSKFLSGVYISLMVTFGLAYVAESSLDYQAAHKALGNDNVKAAVVRNRLFAALQIAGSTGYIFGPGAAVIFAQFHINQFRAIAWFNVAAGVALIALQVALFHGDSSCNKFGKKSWKGSKRCKNLPKMSWYELSILVFLICCASSLGVKFAAFETVYNPVLSDYFGFSEIEGSYFFLALSLPRFFGSVILLLLQQCKLNNRVLLLIGLLMSIAGPALMADWQSIPSDPCTQLSPFHHPELTSIYSNITIATPNDGIDGLSTSGTADNYEDAAHSQALQVLPEDVYTVAMNKCESAAIPNHQCYWTPNSIVTKHHCDDCQPICRSTKRSLNFVQFCIGITLTIGSTALCRAPSIGLISDRIPRESQGIVIGLVTSLQTFARIISPLWCKFSTKVDAAYEVLQKRTVLAMGLVIAIYLPFLVGTVALYRPLGKPPPHKTGTPRRETATPSDHESGDNDASGDDESKQLVPK